MAIQVRTRIKPDINRDGQMSLIAWTDRANGLGTVYKIMQLCAYDDAEPGVTWANYVPGDPAYEKYITILDEATAAGDMAALAAMTQANATAFWNAALDAWATEVKPNIANLVKIQRAVLRVAPRVIP